MRVSGSPRWFLVGVLGGFVAVVLTAAASAQEPTVTTAPPTNSTIPPSDARMSVTTDITYYPGGPDLDAYLPTRDTGPRPALIMIHGGGWAAGDQSELAPWARKAAVEQGWAAFTVDYRLDPTDPVAWADELHDVQAAIRFIVADAARWNLDTDRIMMLGDSAGANLVALVSSVGTADPVKGRAVGTSRELSVPIVAVGLWSPPTDLAQLVPEHGAPPAACAGAPTCDFAWDTPAVARYIGCPLSTCPETYAQASPVSWVDRRTAPSYVANGTRELIPIGQVRAYVHELDANGVTNSFDVLDTSLHAVQLGDQVWPPTERFLSRQLHAVRPATDGDGPPWLLLGAAAVLAVVVVVVSVGVVRRRR
jgi:acetyl esterase/lipase